MKRVIFIYTELTCFPKYIVKNREKRHCRRQELPLGIDAYVPEESAVNHCDFQIVTFKIAFII